jgi:hypothetical protein
MLHGFMSLLVGFRNRESEYFRPLLNNAATILAKGMSIPSSLPVATAITTKGIETQNRTSTSYVEAVARAGQTSSRDAVEWLIN